MSLKALHDQRAKLVADMRGLVAQVTAEARAMTDDEQARFDAMEQDFDRVTRTIERLQRAAEYERQHVPYEVVQQVTVTAPDQPSPVEEAPESREAVHNRVFSAFLRGDTPPELAQFRPREYRDQTVTTSGGGYLISPAFSGQLEIALKYVAPVMDHGEIFVTSTGADLSWPTVNDTTITGRLLAINTAVTTTDVTFGTVTFNAYKYSSDQVVVPIELAQDAAFDVDALVARLLGERLGRILNTHFTTGSGTGQPQGLVTGATLGKQGGTGQTTTVTYDDLVDLVYSIDPAYRVSARWMMGDAILKVIRKLKDSQNRPLWEPSLQVGQPDTLMGYPIVVNNAMPTPAANAKSILFGDFRKYKIRQVRDITMIRLNERYMDKLQIGYVAIGRWDGKLVDAGTNPVKYYQHSAT